MKGARTVDIKKATAKTQSSPVNWLAVLVKVAEEKAPELRQAAGAGK